jgi:hypothetical protein
VRDTQLKEDTHHCRDCNGVQILATLRSIGPNNIPLAGMDAMGNGMAANDKGIKHLLEALGWRNLGGPQPAPS